MNSSPLKYLDKAMNQLRDLGLMPDTVEEAPILSLLERISDIDEQKSLAIARTLSQASVFNDIVREQLSLMNIGERYEEITKAFNSIREDAKSMVQQIDDGKIDTFERISNIPNLLGNAGILSLSEFTRQGAVCREWLVIRNNWNAALCFQANSKNCISK